MALSTERWLGPRNFKEVTVTIAAPGVFTYYQHGLTWKDQVMFTTTGALPSGLSVDTLYYVLPIDADTFSVTATSTGSAITTTGTQSGTHYFASNGRNIMTMKEPPAFE